MKLLSMRTENFMKCVFADVSFVGDRVEITGKNEQGKSSFAKSIWALFGGKDGIPEKPVTNGADHSVLHAELDGDFVLTKVIYPDRSTKLELRNKDGGKYKNSQSILDGFNLRFGFWPQEFIMAEPKYQSSTLRKVAGLDFTRQDMNAAALAEDRTRVGRELKQLQGQLAGCRQHADAPDGEVSAATMLERLKRARLQETEHATALRASEMEENRAMNKRQQVDELRSRIAELELEIDAHNERSVAYRQQVAAMDLPDTDAMERELEGLETANAKVRANAEHRRIDALVAAKQTAYSELSASIDEHRAAKERALAEATFPVAGLGFNDSGVTFEGVPFEQASTARQWEVAVAIGFALNPQLKLVYIGHGSLLDETTLARVEALVAKHGGQLLLETVGDSSGRASVLFEDGIARNRDAKTGEWKETTDEKGTAVRELRGEAAE